MSRHSIARHIKRWADLPTLPIPGGLADPITDGDMATLDELQERVFGVLDEAFMDGRPFGIAPDSAPSERFYYEERWAAGLELGYHYWPDDRAAELLAVWRSQLDGIA
jgi:hypothetical protein